MFGLGEQKERCTIVTSCVVCLFFSKAIWESTPKWHQCKVLYKGEGCCLSPVTSRMSDVTFALVSASTLSWSRQLRG